MTSQPRDIMANLGSIAIVNGLLGWTFVGWVVALAWACKTLPPAEQPAPVRPQP